MKLTSVARQLRLLNDDPVKTSDDDLTGRLFFDGQSAVRVVGACHSKATHVIVEREMDGKSWSISADLVRRITGPAKKKRTA